MSLRATAVAAKAGMEGDRQTEFHRPRYGSRARRALLPYLLIAVPACFAIVFVAYPSFLALINSFERVASNGHTSGFTGFSNYGQLFRDSVFNQVLVNTLLYGGASVVLCVPMSLGLALLLDSGRRKSSRLLMLSLFSPTVLPMIAAANIWLFFLAPRFGLIDSWFSWAGLRNSNLLGEPHSALGVLVALFLWKYIPYFTLFMLAGLQVIPPEVTEALRTEDPHRWYSYRKVILPMIAPMIIFVTTMALLYAFETVDPIFVMTQGGPNNGTNLLVYYLYQQGFSFFNWGKADALSALLLVVFSTIAGVALLTVERRAFHWQ